MLRKLALALLFMTLGTVTALAADITGKWTGTVETPRGTQQLSFSFKVDGSTLTGKITTPRGDSDITDGKIDGDTVTFNQVVNFNGNDMKIAYKGTISGDSIKFTRTVGDRPPAEFAVTRAKE